MSIIDTIARLEAKEREVIKQKEAALKALEAERLAKQAMELIKENSIDIEMIKKELGSINDFIIGVESKITALEGNFDFVVDNVKKSVLELGSEFKDFKKEIKDAVNKINIGVGREVTLIKSEIAQSKKELQDLIESKASKKDIMNEINELNLKIWAFDQKSEQIINSKIDLLKQELKDENEDLFNKLAGDDGLISKAALNMKDAFTDDLKKTQEEIQKLIKDLGERVSFVEIEADAIKNDVIAIKSEISIVNNKMIEFEAATLDTKNQLTTELSKITSIKIDLEDYKKLSSEKLDKAIENYEKLIVKNVDSSMLDDARKEIQNELNSAKTEFEKEMKLEIEKITESLKTKLTGADLEAALKKVEEASKTFEQNISQLQLDLGSVKNEVLVLSAKFISLNQTIETSIEETKSQIDNLIKDLGKLNKELSGLSKDLNAKADKLSETLESKVKDLMELLNNKASNKDIDLLKASIKSEVESAKLSISEELDKKIAEIKVGMTPDEIKKIDDLIQNYNTNFAQIKNNFEHLSDKIEEIKLLQIKADNVEIAKIIEQSKVVDAVSDLVMKALLNEDDKRAKDEVLKQLKDFEKSFGEEVLKIAATPEEKQQLSNAQEAFKLFIEQVETSGFNSYSKEVVKNMMNTILILDKVMQNKLEIAKNQADLSESSQGALNEASKMIKNDLTQAQKEQLAVLTYKLSNDIVASYNMELKLNSNQIKSNLKSMSDLIKQLEGAYNKGSDAINDLIKVDVALQNISVDLDASNIDVKKLLSDLIALNNAEVKYLEDIQNSSKDFAAQEFWYLWQHDQEILEGMNLTLTEKLNSMQKEQA